MNAKFADVTMEYGTMSDSGNTFTFSAVSAAPLVVNTYFLSLQQTGSKLTVKIKLTAYFNKSLPLLTYFEL